MRRFSGRMPSTTTSTGGRVDAASLRAARLARGLSRAELSGLAGCSLASIANLEGGYLPKRSPVLARVLDALADGQSGDDATARRIRALLAALDAEADELRNADEGLSDATRAAVAAGHELAEALDALDGPRNDVAPGGNGRDGQESDEPARRTE